MVSKRPYGIREEVGIQELMQKISKMMVTELITASQYLPWLSTVQRSKTKLRLALHFLISSSPILFHNLWAQPI